MEMALRDLGLDNSIISAMLDFIDDAAEKTHHPSRAYIRDTKAMKATPADIIEYPNAYKFVVDMPGLKSNQISVHLEDGNVLVVSGERKGEKAEKDESVKFLRMERRVGKLFKKFVLLENANTDNISAEYQVGVLTVTVDKKPPPEPKKPKVIEVKVGEWGDGSQQVKTDGSSTETAGVTEGTTKTG